MERDKENDERSGLYNGLGESLATLGRDGRRNYNNSIEFMSRSGTIGRKKTLPHFPGPNN